MDAIPVEPILFSSALTLTVLPVTAAPDGVFCGIEILRLLY